MKKILMILVAATLLTVFACPANALPVVDWVWELNTTGDGIGDTWLSTTKVDVGAAEYQYSWEITTAEVFAQVEAPPVLPQSVSILTDIGPTSGSGSSDDVSIRIFDNLNPFAIDLSEIGADIYLVILSNGMATAQLTNVDLRTLALGGGESYPVVSAKFTGTLHVEAVPEPATVALLGLGCVVLLGKRRRRMSR